MGSSPLAQELWSAVPSAFRSTRDRCGAPSLAHARGRSSPASAPSERPLPACASAASMPQLVRGPCKLPPKLARRPRRTRHQRQPPTPPTGSTSASSLFRLHRRERPHVTAFRSSVTPLHMIPLRKACAPTQDGRKRSTPRTNIHRHPATHRPSDPPAQKKPPRPHGPSSLPQNKTTPRLTQPPHLSDKKRYGDGVQCIPRPDTAKHQLTP